MPRLERPLMARCALSALAAVALAACNPRFPLKDLKEGGCKIWNAGNNDDQNGVNVYVSVNGDTSTIHGSDTAEGPRLHDDGRLEFNGNDFGTYRKGVLEIGDLSVDIASQAEDSTVTIEGGTGQLLFRHGASCTAPEIALGSAAMIIVIDASRPRRPIKL
jgi:hypothetical protein